MKDKLVKLLFLGGIDIVLYNLFNNMKTIYINKLSLLQLESSNVSYIVYKIGSKLHILYILLFIINVVILYKIFNKKEKTNKK